MISDLGRSVTKAGNVCVCVCVVGHLVHLGGNPMLVTSLL